MSLGKSLVALLAVLTTAALVAIGAQAESSRLNLTVTPATGGKHRPFLVAFTSDRATGVVGKTRRSYTVRALAVRPAVACVVDRDRTLAGREAGTRMRATLDPARGKGGELGWCHGRFRGTVTYSEAYACPPRGTCQPPKDFPQRSRVVARFSFRVR